MKHIIMGTAGHVDHGKTSLVQRITGVNTDRLAEEKARGITIDLGFAPFMLADGQRIGVVDVPGHERFIRNMLVGATGIDLVLFVIAANEGVMPQTREHMDILRLLGVDRGVVALTKIDMVDGDWLELIRDEMQEFLKDTPLHGAPIVELSSITGEGIPELLNVLGEICAEVPDRSSSGVCRLAVDRVFTMTGFGTVATGTLWSGEMRTGDILELLPSKRQARVRSLQVHGEKREEAYAGERVAVNLTGVERIHVERGSWLAVPGALWDSRRVDIRLHLLAGAPKMERRVRVHVHHGTAEALARVNLLDCDTLEPGESCFAQLELESPLATLPGDRVVLRFYSPLFTIGGGVVLDASAARHKRFREDVISRLEALDSGDPGQVLFTLLARESVPLPLSYIAAAMQIDDKEAEILTGNFVDSGELLLLHEGFYFPAEAAKALGDKLSSWLREYLAVRPLRFGAPKQEVAQALFPRMGQKELRCIYHYFDSLDEFLQDEKTIRPAAWAPVINDKQAKAIANLRIMYGKTPFAPCEWTAAFTADGISQVEQGELLQWFLSSGELVSVTGDAIYARSSLEEAERLLRGGTAESNFTLAEARDILGIPRKNVQQICEYFDQIKATHRDGEKRVWRKAAI